MTGYSMYIPKEGRYGAAARRPWKIQDEQVITVRWPDILCLVDIDLGGCLTADSLERLRRLGLEVTGEHQTR